MAATSRRIGIFVALVVAAIACTNHLTDSNPGAPCTRSASAQTIPTDTTVVLGAQPFLVQATVLDCHNVNVVDVYTWSSSDTTILDVQPDGMVTPVGIGVAYAIISGESEGKVGSVKVAVGGAAAAALRRTP